MAPLIRSLQNQLKLSDGQFLLMAREAAQNARVQSLKQLDSVEQLTLVLMLKEVEYMRCNCERRAMFDAARPA